MTGVTIHNKHRRLIGVVILVFIIMMGYSFMTSQTTFHLEHNAIIDEKQVWSVEIFTTQRIKSEEHGFNSNQTETNQTDTITSNRPSTQYLSTNGDTMNGTAENRLTNDTLRVIPFDMIKLMAPEVTEYIGKKRLQNFKNPCWYDAGGNLSCVPYFFLLGVTKCGTSDIWTKLINHPQVSNSNKESHWWTQRRFGKDPVNSFMKELKRGVQFLDIPDGTFNNSVKVIGDGSPSTIWDNHNWRRYFPGNSEGPLYVVADLIHSVDPEAKLIVSLRDPIDRLYSSYKFFKRNKLSAEEFHFKVVQRMKYFNECMSTNSLRACAYQDMLNFRGRESHMVQLRIGIYHVFLEDWLRVFPKEQLFIIELQDWHTNCQSLLPQLIQFLDLDLLPQETIRTICQTSPRNVFKQRSNPMLNKTKRLLEEFYNPYNQKLYNMLRDPRFYWDYS